MNNEYPGLPDKGKAKMQYKYVRIQGQELAENTMYAKGIFSIIIPTTWFTQTRPGKSSMRISIRWRFAFPVCC